MMTSASSVLVLISHPPDRRISAATASSGLATSLVCVIRGAAPSRNSSVIVLPQQWQATNVTTLRQSTPRRLRSIFIIVTTIGLIGAGHIGSQIARLAVSHGYRVAISNSRGPETLATLVAELGPNARAATAAEAATDSDIVVVTRPPKNYLAV